MDLIPGAVIAGRYRIDRKIADDGMRQVWSGEHRGIGVRVAVKSLVGAASLNHEVVARFKREAYLLGRIRSDRVARVIDFVWDDRFGRVLVMEFIEGDPLSRILKGRLLTVEEAIDLGVEIASALKDVHAARIIHRNLKPEHIIMRPLADGTRRAVVIDFGLSRLMSDGAKDDDEAISGITLPDSPVGTVEYMSPDQFLNSRDVTPRSDIYAAGATLFRACAGRRIFDNVTSDADLMRMKLTLDAPPLPLTRSDKVAEGLARVVAKMIKRWPSERYKSADEVLADLVSMRDMARLAASKPQAAPIVFLSYASRDESLCRELENHLAQLKRDGHIRAWHPGLVGAGEEHRRRIDEQLRAARIVVLLVSADYLGDDDLYEREMLPALDRMRQRGAQVIPVLLRPHDWERAPFAGLTPLPRNKVPVTSWSDRDDAWVDVVKAIREAVQDLGGRGAHPVHERSVPPMPRHEDAETRALTMQLADARKRKSALADIGVATKAVDDEIRDLLRRLREGGWLRAGDELGDGRYRLINRIGQGGFATVWSAFDRTRRESVAVKVLKPEQGHILERRERFFRGARVMASLGHEAVVRVLLEKGEDGGWLYFVMELVSGGDLHHAVLKGKVTQEHAVAIVLGAGEALAEAHAKGIVHRDVKPANILLNGSGEPRLTDFDLVALGNTTGATTGGMGTYLFASPEQLDNAKDVDARTDVYSLGMTAVFCLHGKDLPATMKRRPERVIEALACSEAVKRVLTRAIEVDAKDRFDDARAFCEALREAAATSLPSITQGVPMLAPRVLPPGSPRVRKRKKKPR